MGISTQASVDNKKIYSGLIERYSDLEPDTIRAALHAFMHPDSAINVTQPINAVEGPEAFIRRVIDPMLEAFEHLYRRSDILIGGEYRGGEWVVSHGHYVGRFTSDWMGIPPSGDVVWLHYIEYHRMLEGRSAECYLYIDMLDLLRQIGHWPLDHSIGYEGFVPGPATGDGILIDPQEESRSTASLKMVDDMLAELWKVDEGWRPYWHPKMYWYGPSGYGSQIGLDGFERFQLPYEAMFEPGSFTGEFRKSGNAYLDEIVKGHFTRFGDGNYVASGGWPSHGGIMSRDWLGATASNQPFTVRVADIWRRQGDLLVENWVFVDVVDMMMQLGVDPFAAAGIELRLQG